MMGGGSLLWWLPSTSDNSNDQHAPPRVQTIKGALAILVVIAVLAIFVVMASCVVFEQMVVTHHFSLGSLPRSMRCARKMRGQSAQSNTRSRVVDVAYVVVDEIVDVCVY